MTSHRIGIMILIYALILGFSGCSSKPSDAEVEVAVKDCLKNNIPVSWVGNLMGGKNAQINMITVREWGSYNKQQEYWPAKVRVVGQAQLRDPFNQGKIKQFDKIAEFRFTKDDYGKWEAHLSGGMFQ